jgi:hypothetical protein
MGETGMLISPNKNGHFSRFFSCMFQLCVVIFASKKTPCLADSNGEAERGFLFGTRRVSELMEMFGFSAPLVVLNFLIHTLCNEHRDQDRKRDRRFYVISKSSSQEDVQDAAHGGIS